MHSPEKKKTRNKLNTCCNRNQTVNLLNLDPWGILAL